MKLVAIIPARFGSSRFPGKPLVDICGKPMVWWVYQQVCKVNSINEVFVATDDERIQECCEKYRIRSIMTSSSHLTSTQRLFEVSNKIEADYYICINGDEPLINPQVIEKVIPTTKIDKYVANLMTMIEKPSEVIDFTNIKVVTDIKGNALFMSRSPIPYPKASVNCNYFKHIGVLIYSKDALAFFNAAPKGLNEEIEDINELRFIENGYELKMIEVKSETLSVDTPKDLEYVRKIINSKIRNGEISNE